MMAFRLVSLLPSLLALAGCGGGSGPGPDPTPDLHPLVGSWQVLVTPLVAATGATGLEGCRLELRTVPLAPEDEVSTDLYSVDCDQVEVAWLPNELLGSLNLLIDDVSGVLVFGGLYYSASLDLTFDIVSHVLPQTPAVATADAMAFDVWFAAYRGYAIVSGYDEDGPFYDLDAAAVQEYAGDARLQAIRP